MKLINPLNQNHGRIIILARLKLLADGVNKAVEVKHYVFGRQARKNRILYLVVDLLGELSHFVILA